MQRRQQPGGKTTEVEAHRQLVCVCVCVFISCLNYGIWQANFTADHLGTITMHCGWSCFRYQIRFRDLAHDLLSPRMCSHSSCLASYPGPFKKSDGPGYEANPSCCYLCLHDSSQHSVLLAQACPMMPKHLPSSYQLLGASTFIYLQHFDQVDLLLVNRTTYVACLSVPTFAAVAGVYEIWPLFTAVQNEMM